MSKNKKIRLTESQLQKLILKEFRPKKTMPGGAVTTSSGKKYRVPGSPKKNREREAFEDVGDAAGDREIAFFDSPQKLNLEFKSSPSLLDAAYANAKSFISNNWASLTTGLTEAIFLGDPNNPGNIVTDPVDTVWNWTASFLIQRGQSISDVASNFQLSQVSERINRLRAFEGVDVVGSIGGQLLISIESLEELCDFGITLLSEPISVENIDDFFAIAALLGGNERSISDALGRSGELNSAWSDFKQKYMKGAIEIFNATTGAKVQTGEADFTQPGPVMATDERIIVNAMEYFKKALWEQGGVDQWVMFSGEMELATKTVSKKDAGILDKVYTFLGYGDPNTEIEVPDRENSTFSFTREAPGNQTIIERLDYLDDYYGRQRQQAQADLNRLGNTIQSSLGDQAKEQLEAFKRLQDIMADTLKIARAIRRNLQTAQALRLPGQGSDAAVQLALQFNESIANRRRNKKLLLEQDSTGNYVGNFGDYVDKLANSQGGPFTGSDLQNYTLTDEDEAALWLGSDQNADPFKMDNLMGNDTWPGPQFASLAGAVVAFIFTEEGMERTGAYINEEDSEVALPHEDSIAFYILDMKSEDEDNPKWINILYQPDFAVAFEEALERQFGQYQRVIKLPPNPEEGPEEPDEDEDEKGKNCPTQKLSVEFDALSSTGARTKKLQQIINKYITHHDVMGGTIGEDGKWGRQTDEAFERVLRHGLSDILNHPVYGELELSNDAISAMASKWKQNARRLNRRGYINSNDDGDVTGALALVYDLYNCNDEYGKTDIERPKGGSSKGKGTPRRTGAVKDGEEEGKCADGSTMKKATWRDIQVQFNQKSKKFSLDKSSVDQLKIDLAKQTAAFVVNPPHNMNPVTKEHVGTFTIGVGGRIKNQKSHDWNVPAAYEKIIDKAMKNLIQKAKKDSKGLDVVRNSNIIITIPCGNYTTLAESIKQKREQDFENILRELIKKV